MNEQGTRITAKQVNLLDFDDQTLMESPNQSKVFNGHNKYIDMSGNKVNI